MRARTVLRALAVVGAAVVVAAAAAGMGMLAAGIPAYADVKARALGSEAVLLDRHGEPLQRLRLDRARRQLDWVALAEVSPALRDAVIAAEDVRFRGHAGVDPLAIAAAVVDSLRHGRPRGASTITMQLAGLLAGRPGGSRDALAKLRQVRDALALERSWTKDEILEAYLNLAPFRGELVGIHAAARGLLRKAPSGIDPPEAAVLAALLRSPAAAGERVGRRACAVLRQLASPEACEAAEFVAAALPKRPHAIPGESDAPHLARRLLARPGERVRSTLDAPLQRFAVEALRGQLAELAARNVEDGAVVVLDNATGDVLAYVGSSGDLSDAGEVDAAAALRQPGSTLKPFLYAVALGERWLTAASILDDSPLALTTPGGLYIPQNYDRDHKGPVTVRTALASSLNVPAVRTLALVGLARFHDRLRALGFSSLTRDAEHYGYGLALGGAEVSLVALANAYRALANGGRVGTVRDRPDAPVGPLRAALDGAASHVIADVLADEGARALTFGFASPLATRSWAAVKTGTSKGMRDNWAVGFTDRYTVAVWVGNASGAPMWDVSGISGAAPVWRAIVEHLHAASPSLPPAAPAGVVRTTVSFAPAIEPPRSEWFVAGTEQQRVALLSPATRPRILSPADGTVVAPDPDIPAGRQRILVRARAASGACLALNGLALGCGGADQRLIALPGPGRHRLTLADARGTVLDEAAFEVRALAPRRKAIGPSASGIVHPPKRVSISQP